MLRSVDERQGWDEPAWGVVGLFALFFTTYLLSATNLRQTIPSAPTFVPLLAGFAFLVAGKLLQRTFAAAELSRRVIAASTVPTLVMALSLCVVLRTHGLAAPRGGMLAMFLEMPQRLFGPRTAAAEIALMVPIEESIKLLPAFLLIRIGVVRRAGDAMLAGALSGLCFGMIEAINHSFFIYARTGSPVTTYLIRALVMAPSHGIGAAIACGVTFIVASTRPRWSACVMGLAVAIFFHAAHNGLQAAFGPAAQIATVFLPLMLLYLLARAARRDHTVAGLAGIIPPAPAEA